MHIAMHMREGRMASNRRAAVEVPPLPPSIEGESAEVAVQTAAEARAAKLAEAKHRLRIKVAIMQPNSAAGEHHWRVDSRGNSLPRSLEHFKSSLAREWRGYCRESIFQQGYTPAEHWNSLVTHLIDYHGCPPDHIARALASAILYESMRTLGNEVDAAFSLTDGDIALAITEEPPLLVIGDMLFKLAPQGLVDGSRALKLLREKALSSAKVKAKAILQSAEQEAGMARRSADEHLATVQRSIRELASQGSTQVQQWWLRLGQYPYKIVNGGLIISFPISTGIREITYTADNGRIYTWEALPLAEAAVDHLTLLHVTVDPLTGKYRLGSVQVDQNYLELPHIGYGSCCMTLSDLPSKLTTEAEVGHLRQRVQEGHAVVNLNSLLRSKDHWPQVIIKQLKPGLLRFMSSYYDVANIDPSECTVRTVQQEAREVFDLGQVTEAATLAQHRVAIDTLGQATRDGMPIPPIPGRRPR